MSNENSNILARIEANSVTLAISLSDLKELVTFIINDEREKQAQSRATANEIATLSSDQVCKTFGISKTTLWHWRKSGIITPTKIGRKILFKESEIKQLLTKKMYDNE